jgi:hypothetical protein
MSIRNAVAVVATLAVFQACVPIADDPAPRGAAGFTLTPTPASAGAPFVTADGYTITIERLVLAVRASSSDSGIQGTTIYYGSKAAQVYATGIRERTVPVTLNFTHFNINYPDTSDDEFERSISDADFKRLQSPFDFSDTQAFSEDDPSSIRLKLGPSVIVSMRATRNSQTFRLDVALGVFAAKALTANLVIERNALVSASVSVDAQALFSNGAELRFAEFAAADGNSDETISWNELIAAPTTPSQFGGVVSNPPKNLGSLLATRCSKLLQRKP